MTGQVTYLMLVLLLLGSTSECKTYRRVDISRLILGRNRRRVDGLGLLDLGDDGRGRRPGDLHRRAVDHLGLGDGAQLGEGSVDNCRL